MQTIDFLSKSLFSEFFFSEIADGKLVGTPKTKKGRVIYYYYYILSGFNKIPTRLFGWNEIMQ